MQHKRVSVLQAITDFSLATADPAAKDVSLLMKLAKRAERDIRTFRSKKLKAVKVTVDGSTTPIPDDCYLVDKIYPGDLTDELRNYWADMTTVGINYDTVYETDFIWSSMDESQWVDTKLYNLLNEEIHFPASFNSQELTVFYLAWEIDAMGYLMVNESHIEAISAYFKLFFVKRQNYANFKSQRMMRSNELNYETMAKKNYHAARGKAKGADLEVTPMDQREIDEVY